MDLRTNAIFGIGRITVRFSGRERRAADRSVRPQYPGRMTVRTVSVPLGFKPNGGQACQSSMSASSSSLI
jgi:hypothetical protein